MIAPENKKSMTDPRFRAGVFLYKKINYKETTIMLFFLNLDGTVTRSDTDHVYQGQNKVANVELFTLTSTEVPIQVAFTLPNGLTTTYAPMSYVGAYSVDKSNQKQVYHWKLAMPYNVTEVEGKVGVSFNLVLKVVEDETSGQTLETINQTTYTASFLVEYSSLPIPPKTATEDELGQLLDLLDKYYAQNASLAAKQPFVVGTVKTDTLRANQQAGVVVKYSTFVDGNGNYPTNFEFGIPKGTTFIPRVYENGDISWSNDGDMVNPATMNIKGKKGETGATPDVSAVAEVSNTVGTPSVVVEKSGSKENPVFNFKFSNIKGQKGDPGVGNANLSNTPGTSDTDGYTQKAVNGIVQNPNLLINPNFAINQRGQTSYTGDNVYTVDRWLSYGATLTPVSNGVSLQGNGDSKLFQRIEHNNMLWGKRVTLTFCINDQTKSATAIFPPDVPTSYTEILSTGYDINGFQLRIRYYPTGILDIVLDYNNGFRTIVVNWAKLEIGSVATEFSPPSIAEELIKCQRYYFDVGKSEIGSYLIGSGVFYSTTLAYITVPIPTTLRKAPTLILGDLSRLTLLGNGKSYTPTEITRIGTNNNAVSLRYSVTGATAGNGCVARLVDSENNIGILAFDAEI